MDLWDAVLVSAGKPVFYTATGRPFREVDKETDRVRFQKVTKFEPGKVYSEGCIRELIRLMPTGEHPMTKTKNKLNPPMH